MKAFRFPVPDIPAGLLLCKALGLYDLFQYENNVKPDYCNAGGIEFLDSDGKWTSVENDEDEDIMFDDTNAMRVALRYICRPTMSLPGDRDPVDFVLTDATEHDVRIALAGVMRMAQTVCSRGEV